MGTRLRDVRRATRRSLADVAAASGLSASFLSLVENDKSDITIGRLTRLVGVYGISMIDLLETPVSADEHIIRSEERHRVESPIEGIDVYLLARDSRRHMMPQLLEIKPGAALAEPGQHDGEEWVYVLSGELMLDVEGLPLRVLGPDDSAYYSSQRPHTFRNPNYERSTRLICVNSPPNL